MKNALVLAALMMALAVPGRSEEIKIGTVDMQKALQSSDAGRKAKAALEKEIAAKRTQFQNEEASFSKSLEEFKKQSAVMNEAAAAKKQAELRAKSEKLEDTRMRTQVELQKKEQEITKPLIDKIRGIIADIAKKKGYTMVIDKNDNIVHFSQDKDDLTQEVIDAFNKQKS